MTCMHIYVSGYVHMYIPSFSKTLLLCELKCTYIATVRTYNTSYHYKVAVYHVRKYIPYWLFGLSHYTYIK